MTPILDTNRFWQHFLSVSEQNFHILLGKCVESAHGRSTCRYATTGVNEMQKTSLYQHDLIPVSKILTSTSQSRSLIPQTPCPRPRIMNRPSLILQLHQHLQNPMRRRQMQALGHIAIDRLDQFQRRPGLLLLVRGCGLLVLRDVEFAVPEDPDDFILALLAVLQVVGDSGRYVLDHGAVAGVASTGGPVVHALQTVNVGF